MYEIVFIQVYYRVFCGLKESVLKWSSLRRLLKLLKRRIVLTIISSKYRDNTDFKTWYGMIGLGLVLCGMLCYGMVWHYVIWYGVALCDMVWCGGIV